MRGWSVISGVLTLAVFVTLALAGYSLYERFQAGNRTRDQFRQSDIRVCREVNGLRLILRKEHEKKVVRLEAQLDRSIQFLKVHPNGIPGISRKLILAGIEDQKLNIADERETIAAVQPDRCL